MSTSPMNASGRQVDLDPFRPVTSKNATPTLLLSVGALLDGFSRCNFEEPLADIQEYRSRGGNVTAIAEDREAGSHLHRGRADRRAWVLDDYSDGGTTTTTTTTNNDSITEGSQSFVTTDDECTADEEDTLDAQDTDDTEEKQRLAQKSSTDALTQAKYSIPRSISYASRQNLANEKVEIKINCDDEDGGEASAVSDDSSRSDDHDDDDSGSAPDHPEAEQQLGNVDWIYREILGYGSMYDDDTTSGGSSARSTATDGDDSTTNDEDRSIMTELVSLPSTEDRTVTVYTTSNIQKILQDFRNSNPSTICNENQADSNIGMELEWSDFSKYLGLDTVLKGVVSTGQQEGSASSHKREGQTTEEQDNETAMTDRNDGFDSVDDGTLFEHDLRAAQNMKKKPSALTKARNFLRIGSKLRRERIGQSSSGLYSVASIDTQYLNQMFDDDHNQQEAVRSPSSPRNINPAETVDTDGHMNALSDALGESNCVHKKSKADSDDEQQPALTTTKEKKQRRTGQELLNFVQRLKNKDLQQLALAVKRFEQRERQNLKKIAGQFRNFHFKSERKLRKSLQKLRREQLKRLTLLMTSYMAAYERSVNSRGIGGGIGGGRRRMPSQFRNRMTRSEPCSLAALEE